MKYLLALGLALAMAHAGTAVNEPRVEDLIQQLDDPRFEVRQYADEALRLTGLKIVPALQAELKKDPPLEVARRLKSIIDHYVRPDWHERIEEAVAEAQRTGKPILVVSMLPTSEDPDQWAPPEFADRQLAHFLKEHYVVVWHVNVVFDLAIMNSNPNVGAVLSAGDGAPTAYLCAADGKVLRIQVGLPALDQLANQKGLPRTLTPQTSPSEDQTDTTRNLQVTPNGGVFVGRQFLNPSIKRQVRWSRGAINPVGMPIQEVLAIGGGC